MRTSEASVAFDAVLVTDAAGSRRVSVSDFFALPLSQRLRHVIAGTVVFLLGDVQVDPRVALADRRTHRVAS